MLVFIIFNLILPSAKKIKENSEILWITKSQSSIVFHIFSLKTTYPPVHSIANQFPEETSARTHA